MNTRIQHLLLIALFAVAQLIVLPLAASASCLGAMVEGGECCCCVEDATPSGCCGQDRPDNDSSDSESLDSSCKCTVTPPAPTIPERNQLALAELVEGLAGFEADSNPLHSGIWPNVAVRAPRPPNQPLRVVSGAEPAFTQVFRL